MSERHHLYHNTCSLSAALINTNIHTWFCAELLNAALLSEISWLIWDSSLKTAFLPADCKDLYVTAEGREDWDQLLHLPSVFHSVWYHVRMRFGNAATDTVVLKLSCGKEIWMCFIVCLGFWKLNRPWYSIWMTSMCMRSWSHAETNHRQEDKNIQQPLSSGFFKNFSISCLSPSSKTMHLVLQSVCV